MDSKAMMPLGMGFLSYIRGDQSAEIVIRRDDGQEGNLPISHFFRNKAEFADYEKIALHSCKGAVLDIGAGAGSHSLYLQELGINVTAIDICPEAVMVMRQRGVKNASCVDIFDFDGGPFDTLLLLGHGLGIVENIAGLGRFLVKIKSLVLEHGQVLLDSNDVRCTKKENNLAYHKRNNQRGKYIGEIHMQLEYMGEKGLFFDWLLVDSDVLNFFAGKAGWNCEVIFQDALGDYLARLTPYYYD